MSKSTFKTQLNFVSILTLLLVTWRLFFYSQHLAQSQNDLEMWATGILFGELIGWTITHPRPGEIPISKKGLLLFSEFFLIIAIGMAFAHSPGGGAALGMAMPFLNAGLGRPIKSSLLILFAVSLVGLLSEVSLWFWLAAIALYYALHFVLTLKTQLQPR